MNTSPEDFRQYIDPELLKLIKRTDPVEYLEKESTATEIPNVYLEKEPEIDVNKPIVYIITGPSGAGKETAVKRMEESGRMPRIVSATTRDRRPGEDESDYIWMRKKNEDETIEEYHSNLKADYDLVESDPHNNNLYGLPRKSLEMAKIGRPGIIHTENNGAKTLRTKLGGEYNFIVVFVMPESYQQLWERMENRNDKPVRLKKGVEEIADAKNIANYYIRNNSTIEDLQRAFETLTEIHLKSEA